VTFGFLISTDTIQYPFAITCPFGALFVRNSLRTMWSNEAMAGG